MLFAVGVLVSLASLAAMHRTFGRVRRHRRAARDPLSGVFPARELCDLDSQLDHIAIEEQRRLDAELASYIAGDVGHVVLVSDSRHGVALSLSDGHRIALGSISRLAQTQLVSRARQDRLRPASVDRKGSSYRLLLRGEVGADVEISTPRLALAA